MKYRKNKIDIKYYIIIIAIIVTLLISILSFVISDNRNLSFVEGTFKDIFVVVEKYITLPIRYVDKKISEYNDMWKIYNRYKNKELVYKKSDAIKVENNELKREIDNLKELLNVNNIDSGFKSINAMVLIRNNSDWYNTITVDKGLKNGVKTGMIATINQALIGKVIHTTNFTSDIKLITTNKLNSKISVGIELADKSVTYGLISGYEKGLIIVDSIIDDSNIEKNNLVFTSGLSDIFPKGIMVGTVSKVEVGEYGLSKKVYVMSPVIFNNIRYLSILYKEEAK